MSPASFHAAVGARGLPGRSSPQARPQSGNHVTELENLNARGVAGSQGHRAKQGHDHPGKAWGVVRDGDSSQDSLA